MTTSSRFWENLPAAFANFTWFCNFLFTSADFSKTNSRKVTFKTAGCLIKLNNFVSHRFLLGWSKLNLNHSHLDELGLSWPFSNFSGIFCWLHLDSSKAADDIISTKNTDWICHKFQIIQPLKLSSWALRNYLRWTTFQWLFLNWWLQEKSWANYHVEYIFHFSKPYRWPVPNFKRPDHLWKIWYGLYVIDIFLLPPPSPLGLYGGTWGADKRTYNVHALIFSGFLFSWLFLVCNFYSEKKCDMRGKF